MFDKLMKTSELTNDDNNDTNEVIVEAFAELKYPSEAKLATN